MTQKEICFDRSLPCSLPDINCVSYLSGTAFHGSLSMFPQRPGILAYSYAAYSDRIAQASPPDSPVLCGSCILSALYLCQCSIQTGFRQQNIPYRVSLLTGYSSYQMKLRIQNLLLSLQNFIRQKLLLHVLEAQALDGRSEAFAGHDHYSLIEQNGAAR